MDSDIIEKVKKLEQKYEAMGQDLSSYLDGLLHADYLTYWDYVHIDTLLSLQNPKTSYPDEMVFIGYHQITELYFKLVLHEQEQLAETFFSEKIFLNKLKRINRYFEALTHSFEIMVDGMDREQFMKFRMSLLPASGFQSAQYRMIEIRSTDFVNLLVEDVREKYMSSSDYEEMFPYMYWHNGATELASGKKTLTLKQFEEKYKVGLLELADVSARSNLKQLLNRVKKDSKFKDEIVQQLRFFDVNVNVNWPLAHYKSAVRYLHKDPEDVAATGGTNWQKYLPPRFQKRIFFPKLWSKQEKEEWGKGWVKKEVFGIK